MSDPEGRPTVAELVKSAPARVYPVGRLDFATSGVLLMTNDGEFANGLLHPRGGVPKTYVLKVAGLMAEEDVEKWRTGVELEDGKTLPARGAHRAPRGGQDLAGDHPARGSQPDRSGAWARATGFRDLMRLARLEFAGVNSDRLRPGEWRALSHDELLAHPQAVRCAQERAPRVERRASRRSARVAGARRRGRVPTHR